MSFDPRLEIPPTLSFELDWADQAERDEIMAQMRALKRQTMNLRVMPSARLMRLRAREDHNRIVGWAGLDAGHTPKIAEVFSLYVVPEYRAFLVGLILETARCAFLKRKGDIERVLVRMEVSSNSPLLRYRLGTELVVEAKQWEIHPDVLNLCKSCELYQHECTEQAYLWVNVDRFLERGYERLGQHIDVDHMPVVIQLDPNRMRRALRPEAAPIETAPITIGKAAK